MDPGILMGVAVNAAAEGMRASSSHPHSLSKRAATISRAFSFSGRFSEQKNGMRKSASAAEVQVEARKENASSACGLSPPEVVVTSVTSPEAEEVPTDPLGEKAEPVSRPRFSIILSASHPCSLPSKLRRKKLRISAKRMEGQQ
jgi:hypothetical protein